MSSKAEITVVFAIASILLFSPTFAQAPNVISTNHQSFASTPFAGINLCAPINLFITPNASQGYSFTAEGETSAINNIKAAFNDSNGLLYITATGPIITNQTLKLTVSLPASNLTVLHHNGPSAAIYVAPGFSPPFLNVTTGFGAGQLYINNISTNAVSLDMSGYGSIIIPALVLSYTFYILRTVYIYIYTYNSSNLLCISIVHTKYTKTHHYYMIIPQHWPCCHHRHARLRLRNLQQHRRSLSHRGPINSTTQLIIHGKCLH